MAVGERAASFGRRIAIRPRDPSVTFAGCLPAPKVAIPVAMTSGLVL
jgi:hypothetical protein